MPPFPFLMLLRAILRIGIIQPPILWWRVPVLIRAAWVAWAMPVLHTHHKNPPAQAHPRRLAICTQGPGTRWKSRAEKLTGGRRVQAGSSGRCRALCITCTVVLPYLPTQQLWEDSGAAAASCSFGGISAPPGRGYWIL